MVRCRASTPKALNAADPYGSCWVSLVLAAVVLGAAPAESRSVDGRKLTPAERVAFAGTIRDHIKRCWAPPQPSSDGPTSALLEIGLNQDGTLSVEPQVVR